MGGVERMPGVRPGCPCLFFRTPTPKPLPTALSSWAQMAPQAPGQSPVWEGLVNEQAPGAAVPARGVGLIPLSCLRGGGGEAVRTTAQAFLPVSPAEYVNFREPSMDMKSVTDRAAQTLLWTELIRGGPLGEGQTG